MTQSDDQSCPSLVLASASQSRARMLSAAGIEFTAQPAYIDEDAVKQSLSSEGAESIDVAETLAELKAVKISLSNPQSLVVGADSILDLEGVWFDKPADLDHAKAHLMTLRGKTHSLATAAVVALGGKRIWHYRDRSNMTMRNFSDAFLERYLASVGDDILSSVGAYHLEGRGAQLFSKVDGDFFSILGLPLLPLLSFLREHNVVQG